MLAKTVDSGASEKVISGQSLPQYPTSPSIGSRGALRYVHCSTWVHHAQHGRGTCGVPDLARPPLHAEYAGHRRPPPSDQCLLDLRRRSPSRVHGNWRLPPTCRDRTDDFLRPGQQCIPNGGQTTGPEAGFSWQWKWRRTLCSSSRLHTLQFKQVVIVTVAAIDVVSVRAHGRFHV